MPPRGTSTYGLKALPSSSASEHCVAYREHAGSILSAAPIKIKKLDDPATKLWKINASMKSEQGIFCDTIHIKNGYCALNLNEDYKISRKQAT